MVAESRSGTGSWWFRIIHFKCKTVFGFTCVNLIQVIIIKY